MLYIGADHGGFKLKEQLIKYLESIGEELKDLGAFELNKDDDYTEFAGEVARYTRLKRENLGIILCRSGIGVDIMANKHRDIRSALCFNNETAKSAREHNGANIMCLPSDYIDFELAKQMVITFIKTPFSMQERHVRRLNAILTQDEKING